MSGPVPRLRLCLGFVCGRFLRQCFDYLLNGGRGVIFLERRGIESGAAVLTVWRYHSSPGDTGIRHATRCPCCGAEFEPAPGIVSAIKSLSSHLALEQSPYLDLPEAAFADPRILAYAISGCHWNGCLFFNIADPRKLRRRTKPRNLARQSGFKETARTGGDAPGAGEREGGRTLRRLAAATVIFATAVLLAAAGLDARGGSPPKASRPAPAAAKAPAPDAKPSLKEALARLKVPPDWLAGVKIDWDMAKPWKDGRIEVRRLLALDDPEKVRQGVKITWLYARKGDIGDGHELPLYLFLSGNYDWALLEYPKYLQKVAGTGATHGYLCYASCFAHFGEYAKALEVLDKAMADLPKPPWRITSTANIWNRRGDIYVEMGDLAKAKQCYAEALRLYPTSDQPNGRHLLARNAAKVQTKLDLMAMESLQTAKLRDGVYTGKSLGYADTQDMLTTVTIKDGKIADIQVKHQEKIDLGATRIIPKRIVDAQSLKVDAVTGATITSQAVVDGAFQALKQAGLQ